MAAGDQGASTGEVGLERGQEGKGREGREGSLAGGNGTSSGMEVEGRSAQEVHQQGNDLMGSLYRVEWSRGGVRWHVKMIHPRPPRNEPKLKPETCFLSFC